MLLDQTVVTVGRVKALTSSKTHDRHKSYYPLASWLDQLSPASQWSDAEQANCDANKKTLECGKMDQ